MVFHTFGSSKFMEPLSIGREEIPAGQTKAIEISKIQIIDKPFNRNEKEWILRNRKQIASGSGFYTAAGAGTSVSVLYLYGTDEESGKLYLTNAYLHITGGAGLCTSGFVGLNITRGGSIYRTLIAGFRQNGVSCSENIALDFDMPIEVPEGYNIELWARGDTLMAGGFEGWFEPKEVIPA